MTTVTAPSLASSTDADRTRFDMLLLAYNGRNVDPHRLATIGEIRRAVGPQPSADQPSVDQLERWLTLLREFQHEADPLQASALNDLAELVQTDLVSLKAMLKASEAQ